MEPVDDLRRPPLPAPARQEAVAPERPPLLASQDILRGHKSVEIHHHGVVYRLQATRLGKLILTK